MEKDHTSDEEVGKNRICAFCIGDTFLQKLIAEESISEDCDYCARTEKTVSLSKFADWIESAFESYFTRTADQPSDWEVACKTEWEREGTLAVHLICDEAQVKSIVASDTLKVLEARHSEPSEHEETEFDKDAHYEKAIIGSGRYDAMWQDFKKSIHTRTRFFNRRAEAILGEIFGGLQQTSPAITEAGPDKQLKAIFRARTCLTKNDLKQVVEAAEVELGSRRPGDCPAGRMNPSGIAMFYGAKTAKAALNEVRPPVGSSVVVGRFEFVRPLRLLDLGKLAKQTDFAATKDSIFDPEHRKHMERLSFLEEVSLEFSLPVMPTMETESYLPTQVVADFLSTRILLSLDGLIFKSSQSRGAEENVVLFTTASRVQQYKSSVNRLFQGRKVYPDGGEMDAYVSAELAVEVQEVQKGGSLNLTFPPLESEEDDRKPALRLDLNSLQIHEVEAVDIVTTSHPVLWFESPSG